MGIVGVVRDEIYNEKRREAWIDPWGMLWSELCPPQKIFHALTLRPCEYDLIWE